MTSKKLVLLLFIFTIVLFKSQSTEEQTKQYYKIALEYDKQPKEAKLKILNLLEVCETKKNFVLAAMIYNKMGHWEMTSNNIDKAIDLFKKGIEVGDQSTDKAGVALNTGFLGYLYLNMKMKNEGEKNIVEAIDMVKNTNGFYDPYVLSMLYTLQGSLKNKSLEERVAINNKVIANFKKLPPYSNKQFNLVGAYQNSGYLALEQKKYDEALKYIKTSASLNTDNIPYFKSGQYLLTSMIYSKKNKMDSVLYFATKAEKYIDQKTGTNDLLLVYGLKKDAYDKLKDTVNRNRYSALEAILNNKVYDSNLSAAGNNLEKSLHREEEQKRSSFIYLLIGGFIFILLITALLVLNWKRRKEVAAFKKFRLDAKNLEDRPTVTVVANTHDVALEDAINADTEKEILNGLAQFENKTQFNEKGITLGKLSTQLNTNVKYLSHVVKKHKADNFNLYINQLRVNHVVKQLKDDECFIKYKISHLSEISGYSSPAAFTRAFSEITGVIPSTYIKLLSEEKLKKA